MIDDYPGPADSAGYYVKFARRVGNYNYWSDEILLEAIGILLENIALNAEEGKYIVSFAMYDGSAGTESLSVIKEGGEWVLNE